MAYYHFEGFEKNIRYDAENNLSEELKKMVESAIDEFLQKGFKWSGGFRRMRSNPDSQEYLVLVDKECCRHCDVMDIYVTMGWWDNVVARLTLYPKPKGDA